MKPIKDKMAKMQGDYKHARARACTRQAKGAEEISKFDVGPDTSTGKVIIVWVWRTFSLFGWSW